MYAWNSIQKLSKRLLLLHSLSTLLRHSHKNDARSQPPSTFLRPSFWRSFTPHSVHMGTMWQECLKSVPDQRRHCADDSTTELSRFTWADCSLGNKKYALHELQSGPATTYHLRPEAFSFVVLTGQSLRSDEVTNTTSDHGHVSFTKSNQRFKF